MQFFFGTFTNTDKGWELTQLQKHWMLDLTSKCQARQDGGEA